MIKTENTESLEKQTDLTLYLAPMAGYTDLPFRLLSQENGAEITTSEMISAKGLIYNDRKTNGLAKTVSLEKNFGLQIFGSEPDVLKRAVSMLEERREQDELSYDFLDFNVGCPAPKIVKNGDGSALLKDLPKLKFCIKAIKSEVNVPLSVKIRTGFYHDEDISQKVAHIVEDSGADRIVVHPRTREQFYSGLSDWEIAQKVLTDLSIPVVLSGDITSPQRAGQAYEMGFRHLMIGRAAVENPTIFKQIRDYLTKGSYEEFTVDTRKTVALRHIELVTQFSNSSHLIVALRKQLAAYVKGMENASAVRNTIFSLTDVDETIKLIRSLG